MVNLLPLCLLSLVLHAGPSSAQQDEPEQNQGPPPGYPPAPEGAPEYGGEGADGQVPPENIPPEYQEQYRQEYERRRREAEEAYRQGRMPPGGMPGRSPRPGAMPQEGEAATAEEEPPPKPEKPRGPMSLKDASVNLPTIVESYVARNSPRGHLPLKERGGRIWHLQLEKVSEDTTRKMGPNLFSACADMLDKRGSVPLDVDFTVDFGGSEWKVREVRIHKVDGQARFEYDPRNRRVPVGKGKGKSRPGDNNPPEEGPKRDPGSP